jgi:hypothetical protein
MLSQAAADLRATAGFDLIHAACTAAFGPAFEMLTLAQAIAVMNDVCEIVADEDVPLDAAPGLMRQRIGGVNVLRVYANLLLRGES